MLIKKHIRSAPILLACVALLCAPSLKLNADNTGAANEKHPEKAYLFDAREFRRIDLNDQRQVTRAWDTMHLLSALQGLANRHQPRLYILYCNGFGVETDAFWWEWFRNEDEWLADTEIIEVQDLTSLLEIFDDVFDGLVVYDPKVPATSNAASTAAGCENLLPVRYDTDPGSLYKFLVDKRGLQIKLRLINPDGSSRFTGEGKIPGLDIRSTGSAKVDTYIWAIHRYLNGEMCNPEFAAYYIDAWWLQHPQKSSPTMHTLSNHDYFIANKAFFFDLSPWGDEQPCDDPEQPPGLDKKYFIRIMHRLYSLAGGGMIKVGGFPPWPFKYTDFGELEGKHEPVPTEWEFARLISQFNGYMEADAAGLGAMANASFTQHYPLKKQYQQPNSPTTDAQLPSRFLTENGNVKPMLYVGHYVGDYDSPSWLYKAVPAFFKSPDRDTTPLAWAFNPNLSHRTPQALVYAYKHAAEPDFFVAGDSGAGYLNPRALTVRPDSKLPPGLNAWVRHCKPLFEQWDMSITGFVLDGAAGMSTETEFNAYKIFSPNGAGTHFESGPKLFNGLPTCPERDIPGDVNAAADLILQYAAGLDGAQPRFLWARSILKSPSWYSELTRSVKEHEEGGNIVFLDPYTFFNLIKKHHSKDGIEDKYRKP